MSARNRPNPVPEALFQVDNRTAQSVLIQLIKIFIFDNYRCKHVETQKIGGLSKDFTQILLLTTLGQQVKSLNCSRRRPAETRFEPGSNWGDHVTFSSGGPPSVALVSLSIKGEIQYTGVDARWSAANLAATSTLYRSE